MKLHFSWENELPSLQRSGMPLESHANPAWLPLSETKGNVQMESRDCALFLQHIVKTMNKTMQEHLLHHNTTVEPLDVWIPDLTMDQELRQVLSDTTVRKMLSLKAGKAISITCTHQRSPWAPSGNGFPKAFAEVTWTTPFPCVLGIALASKLTSPNEWQNSH